MKIFITGGAGFIGSHIAEEYLKKGHAVTVFDNFSTGKIENLDFGNTATNLSVIKGDIRDYQLLSTSIQGHDIVFHEAAVASVQKSIENPLETFDINARGTLHVLESSKNGGIKKVIFACSAAIFGDEPNLPKTEQSMVKPISPYGSDKYTSECYLKFYSTYFGLPTVSLRYFNVFGPRQDPSSPYSGVISIFADRFINGKPITIFGDGGQYRDFIYVKDIVQINMLAAEKQFDGFEFFNAGYGQKTSINDLVHIMASIMNTTVPVHYHDARPGDIRESVTDNTKARTLLGFEQQFSVRDGLALLLDSLRG